MRPKFDFQSVINQLKQKRKIFVSEADFQLEMAWVIKDLYPNAKVRLEYCPDFNPNMHIDILVVLDNMWIPIELKYKTKGCTKIEGDETFYLKNQGAKDISCYLYLCDIQRIENIREHIPNFFAGYTVFLTNDTAYQLPPKKSNCIYNNFSLHEGATKSAGQILDWQAHANNGTRKRHPLPIQFHDSYSMNWQIYSKIDDSNTGTFIYLVNEIQ